MEWEKCEYFKATGPCTYVSKKDCPGCPKFVEPRLTPSSDVDEAICEFCCGDEATMNECAEYVEEVGLGVCTRREELKQAIKDAGYVYWPDIVATAKQSQEVSRNMDGYYKLDAAAIERGAKHLYGRSGLNPVTWNELPDKEPYMQEAKAIAAAMRGGE